MKQPNRTGWTFPAGKIQGPKSDGFGPGTQPPDPVFPLETGRLVLREFRPEDKSDLLGFIDDPDQLKLMLFSLATEAEIDRFLDGAVAQAGKSDRTEWHWAVEERGLPGVVGSVALTLDDGAPSSAELGYWFQRPAWGRGYAFEASCPLVHFGFKSLGLHRIWGKCHVANRPSERILEKLGMTREGLVREHVWMGDHYRSSHLFSILNREYL